jgi:hypothetical protein
VCRCCVYVDWCLYVLLKAKGKCRNAFVDAAEQYLEGVSNACMNNDDGALPVARFGCVRTAYERVPDDTTVVMLMHTGDDEISCEGFTLFGPA